uniref:Alpha-conotoxin Cp20.3 n=1 Tax=Conus capitaneus TaxID=89439 RepID=CDK3_CONCE|nr:RecName: Full=Alpha-conotoxin Cp20.3; AltName: Full=Conopeptide alpha-D-Cp; Flags: Precursor [Conus capitaneus]
MPKLAVVLLVLLILPLSYFDAAGGQAVQGDRRGNGLARYLQRGDREVQECQVDTPGSSWGKCCMTRMCGTMCCSRSVCTCVYHWRRGHGCSCPG